MIKKEIIQWPQYVMCSSNYAVDHIVAPSPSNNTHKICIWICAWNNYVSYTLVCVHFIVCSMYVSSCSTPSFSSHANSAIPTFLHKYNMPFKRPFHCSHVPLGIPIPMPLAWIYLCVYLCVFCVFLFHTAYMLYYCERGWVDLMGLKPNP